MARAHAVGCHAPKPTPARPDPADRRGRGAHQPRRPGRPDPRGRAGQEDVRARVLGPAGAAVGRGPARRPTGRRGRCRDPRARQTRRRPDPRRVRGPGPGARHGRRARARRAEAPRVGQRAAARPHRARGPRRRRRGLGGGLLRNRDAGPGRARAGGRPGHPGGGRRDRPDRLDAVAPRRPAADRPGARPSRGARADHPGRGGRRVREPRGPPHADPRLSPRDAHRAAGEDVVRPRGVVPGPRPPAPRADLAADRIDAGRAAGRRARSDRDRRRRVRLVLAGGDRQRDHVPGRAVRGAERAPSGDGRLHEQPAVRRDARLRCAAGLLRPRGQHGPAGRRRSASTPSSCVCATSSARARSCRPDR